MIKGNGYTDRDGRLLGLGDYVQVTVGTAKNNTLRTVFGTVVEYATRNLTAKYYVPLIVVRTPDGREVQETGSRMQYQG